MRFLGVVYGPECSVPSLPSSQVSGISSVFNVSLRDMYGNPVDCTSGITEDIVVSIADSNMRESFVSSAVCGENSIAEITMVCTREGSSVVWVTINGLNMSGTPFSFAMNSSTISAGNSSLIVSPSAFQVGSLIEAEIVARDGFNNTVDCSMSEAEFFSVELVGASASTLDVLCNGSHFAIEGRWNNSGAFPLVVSYKGTAIAGSGQILTLSAGLSLSLSLNQI